MDFHSLLNLLPPLPQLWTFIAAGLLLNLIPGPDMLYVIVQSSQGSRRRGLLAALAIGCGTFFHISVVSLGLAGILATVPLAFGIVRLAGAGLLIWLGLGMLRGRDREPAEQGEQTDGARARLHAGFLQGMLTNILNPKVALFFLAFLPQFCSPQRGPASLQLALLGLIFNLNGTLVLLIVAIAASSLGRLLRRGRSTETWLRRIGGSVLLALGLRLLLQRQSL